MTGRSSDWNKCGSSVPRAERKPLGLQLRGQGVDGSRKSDQKRN